MLRAWSWAVSYMYLWHLLCSGHWQRTASVTVSMGAATNGLLSVTFFDSWVVIVTCDIAPCLLFKCKMDIGWWTRAAELLRQSYLQLKHLASRITQTHISGLRPMSCTSRYQHPIVSPKEHEWTSQFFALCLFLKFFYTFSQILPLSCTYLQQILNVPPALS